MKPTITIPPDALAALAQKVDVAQFLQAMNDLDAGELRRLMKKSVPYIPPEANGDFYDIGDLLTPDERAKQMLLRRFLEEEVRPIINDYWERGEFPKEIIPKLRPILAQTFFAEPFQVPGTNPLLGGIYLMEMGRGEPSISTFLGVHRSLCMGSIYLFGSEEQKAKWLPPMVRLEKIGSWALTEPLVGSAAAAGLLTTAQRQGDTWVINGEKKWSGNATFADVNVIWAKDVADNQVKGFLVELGTPGYSVEKLPGKIAKRAIENVLIKLDNCRVLEENRLPGVNSFRDVARQLASGRAGVAWEATGLAMGAYEQALKYTTERHQFGRPIASFQLIQDKLVQMLGNVTAMQSMMVRLAQLEARDGDISHERASLAKVFCGKKMRETVALARESLGGNGILLEHHVARLFADAEAVYSYEGTNEMNTLIVGRAITGISAFV